MSNVPPPPPGAGGTGGAVPDGEPGPEEAPAGPAAQPGLTEQPTQKLPAQPGYGSDPEAQQWGHPGQQPGSPAGYPQAPQPAQQDPWAQPGQPGKPGQPTQQQPGQQGQPWGQPTAQQPQQPDQPWQQPGGPQQSGQRSGQQPDQAPQQWSQPSPYGQQPSAPAQPGQQGQQPWGQQPQQHQQPGQQASQPWNQQPSTPQGYGQQPAVPSHQWDQPSSATQQQWGPGGSQGGYPGQPGAGQQSQPGQQGQPWDQQAPKKTSRGLLVGILSAVVVVALVVTAYFVFFSGSTPEALEPDVSSSTQATVGQLVVGNCLTDLADDGSVGEVSVVPCSDDHTAQVVGSTTFTDGDFPGQSTLVAQTTAICTPDLVTSGEVAPEDLSLVVWTPSEKSWASDDRVGLCLATVEGGIAGSLLD